MPSVNESLISQLTPIGADLKAGVDSISLTQNITFTLYVRLILPVDGTKFWVRADQVKQGALYGATLLNGAVYNQPAALLTAAPIIIAPGSLHYASRTDQTEEEVIGINRVVFTSEVEIQDFNAVGPAAIYIGEFTPQNGEAPIRFSFSERGSYYQQSGLYHYVGQALYADMQTQIIDKFVGFDQSAVISNSLPFWLQLNKWNFPAGQFPNLVLPLFPSFLVTENLAPPFASVHVHETTAIQSMPWIDSQGNHWQLVQDKVRITTYGARNNLIMDFIDCVNEYTLLTDNFGIQNMPVARDEKKTQSELGIIAQKKTIEYEVDYYQFRARDIALKLIDQASANIILNSPFNEAA
jgi:hypothetical protein